MSTPPVLTDISLAQRLERCEGRACATFVEERARVSPGSKAAWEDIGGTYAMFDGVNSPITQSFGLGMFEPVTDEQLTALERFFAARGSGPFHEVCPLAGKSVAVLLSGRGYEPFEFTSAMFLPLAGWAAASGPARNPGIQVRIVGPEDYEAWSQLSVRGWSEFQEYADFMLDYARIGVARTGAVSFLAELNGIPVATGSLAIYDGVALMSGASTIPEARSQGAQRALLDARLAHAASTGCDLAMMCAEPGSASQRNAERQGFRIAYTRMKWRRRESA